MKAKLALEDGTVFAGESFGAEGEKSGEVVFNTAMSGYQEILTDPSYKGQIVTMTYPHIGNTGVNGEDFESGRLWVEGFVAREFSPVQSNHRADRTLRDFLRDHGIPAIHGIDTRAITRRLRIGGAMNGVLSTVDLDDASLVAKAKAVPTMVGLDLVQDVTCDRARHWKEFVTRDAPAPTASFRHRVALIDCGAKFNIVRSLLRSGCDVTVFPAPTPAEELLGFDGVCISNGPGDPAAVTATVETAKTLVRKEKPLFGICLGHQILGLAVGARVYKLKFGHHGANHPVKDLTTGRVEITSQNHGFAVEEKSLREAGGEVTHLNLNDGTIEGFRHRSLPVASVQYHPEAAPGPRDAWPMFERFTALMKAGK